MKSERGGRSDNYMYFPMPEMRDYSSKEKQILGPVDQAHAARPSGGHVCTRTGVRSHFSRDRPAESRLDWRTVCCWIKLAPPPSTNTSILLGFFYA